MSDILDPSDLPVGAVLAIVVLVVTLVVLSSTVRAVPQGMEYTLERFGRYLRTLRPGLNLTVPFVDAVGHRLNMMERRLEVPSQQAITRDNAAITVDGIVYFQVVDAVKAAYEVSNLDNAILNLTLTNIRTVMGSMDLDELLSKRDAINVRLLGVIDDATSPWGVKVTRIEIKDITPPQNLLDSMGRQMQAERDRRAAILEAEGQRQAAVLRAEGEKQARILEAEGRREAAMRDAEARERLAAAEAEAAAMMGRAIADGSPHGANYFVAQRYLDVLAALARSPNQKTLIMPIDATAALGALAGIAELVRDAGDGRGPGPTAEAGGPRLPPPPPAGPWGRRPTPPALAPSSETMADDPALPPSPPTATLPPALPPTAEPGR